MIPQATSASAVVPSDLAASDPAAASIPVVLTRRRDAPPIGSELEALAEFRESAKCLKDAELWFRAAQQAYADAVKRLSEEATK